MRRANVWKPALGLVVLWVLGVATLAIPAWRQHKNTCNALQALRAQAALKTVGERELDALQSQFEAAQRRALNEVAEIPQEADVALLIGALSSRLDSLGVGGGEISTGAPRSTPDAMYVPVTVTMRGSFLSVYAACRWIESLPRLVRISRLRFERLKAANNSGSRAASSAAPGDSDDIRAELALDVFYRPAPLNGEADREGS
ncbi:MAG: hypothetical protein D6824_02060 [Planctomycetota bacterium]|nr:MAG: hypothetical protein D6824_02060 [Planctomycetota bacterium]